jgi:ribosome-associated translation inhibitor RaiA
MEKNSLKYTVETFTSDPEVKAHIYQQLTEFEPYLLPGSHIAVLIRDTKKQPGVVVTFSLSAEGGQIHGKGKGADVYEAAKMAKEDILSQFDSIQNQLVSAQDREVEISQITNNPSGHTLH